LPPARAIRTLARTRPPSARDPDQGERHHQGDERRRRVLGDPKQDPNATFYDEISYRDVMLEELKVMDQTAVTLCKENALPLIVLNIHRPGAIAAAVRGERIGTLVR
jgi:hypothetical protein